MPATTLARSNRFFRPGTTHVISMPAVASTTLVPTRTEINAGNDVSREVAAVSGFTVSGSTTPTRDWGSRVETNVSAWVTFAESTITFWADKLGADVRTLYALDQVVYIAFMDAGDVPAQKMDVYKCSVLSVSSTKDGDNAVQVVVTFSINNVAEQVAIPA